MGFDVFAVHSGCDAREFHAVEVPSICQNWQIEGEDLDDLLVHVVSYLAYMDRILSLGDADFSCKEPSPLDSMMMQIWSSARTAF